MENLEFVFLFMSVASLWLSGSFYTYLAKKASYNSNTRNVTIACLVPAIALFFSNDWIIIIAALLVIVVALLFNENLKILVKNRWLRSDGKYFALMIATVILALVSLGFSAMKKGGSYPGLWLALTVIFFIYILHSSFCYTRYYKAEKLQHNDSEN